MIYDDFCSANNSVSSPQRMLAALGRLQAHTTSTVLSSLYVYDLIEQRTLYASCPVATILGYTVDAVEAMSPVGLASFIHPDDLSRVAEHYQRFTALRYGEVIAIEYRMRRADGTWCRLRSQETPLVEATDGFPLQVLGMLQDITLPSITNSKPSMVRQTLKRQKLIRRVKASPNRSKRRILVKIARQYELP